MSITSTPNLALLILNPILITLAVISVTLRLWSRYITPKDRFDWEDVYILASLICLIVDLSLIIDWATLGPADHERGAVYSYVAYILFVLALSIPKFAVLSFYNRIFSTSNSKFRIVVWVFGIVNLILTIIYTLLSIFTCDPVHKAWDDDVSGTCLSQYKIFITFGGLSVILDVGILLMPLVPLWSLQVAREKKLLLLSIFILGYTVPALAIARTVLIQTTYNEFNTYNFSSLAPFLAVAATEATVSVVGACVPMMYHFFVQVSKGGWRSVVQKKYFGRDNRAPKHSTDSSYGSGLESGRAKRDSYS